MLSNYRKPPVSRRKARFELKYRGTLLCEWCNKHTEVDMEFYKKAMDTKEKLENKGHEFIFFCRRERCIKGRPETLTTHMKRRNKRNESDDDD